MDTLFIQNSNSSKTSIFDFAYKVEDRNLRLRPNTHLLGYYGSLGDLASRSYMFDHIAKIPPSIAYGMFKPIVYMTRKLR